jgi:hypothetical protein
MSCSGCHCAYEPGGNALYFVGKSQLYSHPSLIINLTTAGVLGLIQRGLLTGLKQNAEQGPCVWLLFCYVKKKKYLVMIIPGFQHPG